jgi:hypothetical protein
MILQVGLSQLLHTQLVYQNISLIIHWSVYVLAYRFVGTSHMTDNRQASVSRQRLVTFMSMVTQQYVT